MTFAIVAPLFLQKERGDTHREVREERSEKYAWPKSRTEYEECGERYAGWRPNQSGESAHRIERETDTREYEIRNGKTADPAGVYESCGRH